MSTKLEKMRDELAKKWWQGEILSGTYDYDLEWVFKQGFDAADAHYRPIVEELLKALEYPEMDCGDNSCRFADKSKSTGMRTNGGCRCTDKFRNEFARKALQARQALESVRGKL